MEMRLTFKEIDTIIEALTDGAVWNHENGYWGCEQRYQELRDKLKREFEEILSQRVIVSDEK